MSLVVVEALKSIIKSWLCGLKGLMINVTPAMLLGPWAYPCGEGFLSRELRRMWLLLSL